MIKCFEKQKYGYVFELGRGKNYSIKEVVMMFSELSSGDVSWTHIPEIPGETRETLCESTLAKEKLGWKPEINLEEWLQNEIQK